MIVHRQAGLRRITSSARISIYRHPILCSEPMDVPKTTIAMTVQRMDPSRIVLQCCSVATHPLAHVGSRGVVEPKTLFARKVDDCTLMYSKKTNQKNSFEQ